MAGFGAPFQVPNAGAAATGGTPSLLVTLLTALGQIPKVKQEKKENAMRLKTQQADIDASKARTQAEQQRLQMEQALQPYKIAELKNTAEQQQQQFAQQQIDRIAAGVRAGTIARDDPGIIAKLKEWSGVLNQPLQLDPDGKLSENFGLKPSSTFDPKVIEGLLAYNTEPWSKERAALARSAGVLPDANFMSVPHLYSNKDESAKMRAEAYKKHMEDLGIHYKAGDQSVAERTRQQGLIAQARVANYAALSSKEIADARLALNRAQVVQQEADAKTKSAEAAVNRVQVELVRAQTELQKTRTGAGDAMMKSAYESAQRQVADLEAKYAEAKTAYDAEYHAGVDDDILTAHLAKANGFKAAVEQAKDRLKHLGTAIVGQHPGLSAQVKAESGAVGVTITDANVRAQAKPAAKPAAAKPTSAQQQPVEVRSINGVKWGRFADGTYRQIP